MSTSGKKILAKLYDEHAKNKEVSDDQVVSVCGARSKLVISEIRRLVSLMSFRGEDLVLDAGCGAGRFVYRIRKATDCQVVAIDTSLNMIERSKKRVPDAQYLLADVLHLPFRREVFTAIICYSVLWHIPSEKGNCFINRDIYDAGLREFKRVSEVEGKVLFNISNPFHPQSIIDMFASALSCRTPGNVRLQTYGTSLGMVKNILAKLGFRIFDISPSGYYPMLIETIYNIFHRFPSDNLTNRYYHLFRRLGNTLIARKFPNMFAHTFVIRAISSQRKETANKDIARSQRARSSA